jgi:hypothetical protein
MARATQFFAGLVVAGATALPWATYKDLRTDHTTTLTAGRMGIAIAAAALLSLAFSLLASKRDSKQMHAASLVLGCVALVVCVGTALNRISTANDLAAQASPGSGSHTAYAFGAAVALVAALVMPIAGSVSRDRSRRPARTSRSTLP